MSTTKLVGMSLKQAQWLGMAASVAGGCVATSDAGRDAANAIGFDCIGRVPDSWLMDPAYAPLNDQQVSTVRKTLSQRCSGWSGAEAINSDRQTTLALLT